jgi:hypothetical protein
MQLDFDWDDLSVWLVAAVTILALVAGWVVKTTVETQTKPVQQSGLTVSVPQKWLVQTESTGTELIVASNISEPQQRLIVSLLPSGDDLTLPRAGSQRNLERARSRSNYRVLTQGDDNVNGRVVYKIEYAYVKAEPRAVPVVVKGVDYLFFDGGRILGFVGEDNAAEYDMTVPLFERLLGTVRYVGPVGGGGMLP